MSCLCPILVGDASKAMVPCGRCTPCRIRRKQAWVGRLRLEAQCHRHSRVLTLTYAPEHRSGKLNPDHFTDFMKRYRYHYGECRYFGVGEYGEEKMGEHFHVIIFGHAFSGSKYWKDNKAWCYGFTYDDTIDLPAIGYVGGYTLKWDDEKRRPITRMSLKPGIGFERIGEMARNAAKIGLQDQRWPVSYRVGGRHYPLCQGGRVHFERVYCESGGLPPATLNPEERHLDALVQLSDWGPRLAMERAALLQSQREVKDGFAATKTEHRSK